MFDNSNLNLHVDNASKPDLEPLEIPKDPCALTRKVLTVFGINIATIVFGMAAGASLSLLGIGLSLAAGTAIGGIVGLVAGIVLSILILNYERAPIQKYRIQTLEQMAQNVSKPELKQSIAKAHSIFSKHLNDFDPIEHYSLHNAVTDITAQMKTHPHLEKVWTTFLNRTQGLDVTYLDGTKIKMDFSLQLARLEGKKIAVEMDRLNPLNTDDLKQVIALQQECFSNYGTVTFAGLKECLTKTQFGNVKPDECIIARRKGSEEILGMLKFRHFADDHIHVTGIGRLADAAKLGIGNRLLDDLLSNHRKPKITLQVREHNIDAIKLYEKFFFKPIRRDPLYYQYPNEDAIMMQCDVAAYIEAQEEVAV